MVTLFEYLYRDAGNFKAFGTVALQGGLSAREQRLLSACFDKDGLFVAEQIGVPPLYQQLYQWSGGPTPSDHCWHEFLGLKFAPSDEVPVTAFFGGTAKEFLELVRSITVWDGSLSPHFERVSTLGAY